MSKVSSFSARCAPRLLSVLRMVAAFLFMAHGAQKLLGYPSPLKSGTASIMSLTGIAGVLELVGGALLFLGLLTRPVAFILAGEMAVAYFRNHAPGGFWPLLNDGEPAVIFCFVFLYLAAAGGGPWSVDSALRNKR